MEREWLQNAKIQTLINENRRHYTGGSNKSVMLLYHARKCVSSGHTP